MSAVVERTDASNRNAQPVAHSASWSELQFNARRAVTPERSWRLPAALAVAAMHALALAWLASTRFSAPPSPTTPLQISFITRPAPVPASQSTPEPSAPTRTGKRQHPAAAPATMTAEVLVETSDPPNARLRLNLSSDPWQLPTSTSAPATLQKDYVDRLPGRSEAYVEGIALHEELTPQKVVEGIGALLFGAVKIDPCEPARRRLANRGTRNDVDSIAADLRVLEQQCRP